MAESNVTKKALANALKELMKTKQFDDITVGNICEQCDMNRKSFYYHFKDKYDLVNWIFISEFNSRICDSDVEWAKFEKMCDYFYENYKFYHKILRAERNSYFSDFLSEVIYDSIENELRALFYEKQNVEFCINFYTDASVCAIKRWLTNKAPVNGKQFFRLLKNSILVISKTIEND